MAMFENFPYTNLHELNLDWLIDQLNKISETTVLSVNGQTGNVILYQNHETVLPNVPEDNWSMIRMCDGSYRGILFGNDDKAYIIHGNLMAQIYSQNNQPPYPVTKVNGMIGNVELYTEQYVRLPDLDDVQMTNWTFFRMLNNKSHGIQFEDDGTAYIINGTSRYVLYTSQSTPPYPVTSVNGKTGAVILFTDTNGNLAYPALDDPDYEGWSINRSVNGTNVGLEFKEDGSLVLKVGPAEYTVYTSNEPQESYVQDPTAAVQEVTEASSLGYWGLIRTTAEGDIGLLFNNADPSEPKLFLSYVDQNQQQQTLKIMTTSDIPSSGVITVNGLYGIVTLTGEDVDLSTTDSRSINEAVIDTENLIAYLEDDDIADIGYTVNTFVIMNNQLYRVTTPISQGDQLIPNTNIALNYNMGTQLRIIKSDIATLQDNKTSCWLAGTRNLIPNVKCCGHITSGGQNVHFWYPAPIQPGLSVTSINFSNLTVRGVAGYVFDNKSNFSDVSITANVYSNGIHFIVSASTSVGTNNTPIDAEVTGTVVLS